MEHVRGICSAKKAKDTPASYLRRVIWAASKQSQPNQAGAFDMLHLAETTVENASETSKTD